MVKHIVIWKLKEENKEENALKIKEALEALNGQIPGLLHLEVGFDFSKQESSSDIVLYSEFDSVEHLNSYVDIKINNNKSTPQKIMDGVRTPPLKIGDVIGDVLYSDITAYINGYAIPSSVINGKTLVVAEDLAKYGFDVKWDGTERTLKVELNKNKKITPLKVDKDTTQKPGTFKCNYLFTDIRTYLSGEVVDSYAIDGRTLIDFELLKKYGKISWDGKTRELRLVIE